MSQGAQAAETVGTTSRLRIGGIVVLAIVVAVIVWLIVKGDDKKIKSAAPPPASAATLDTLRTLPGQLGHSVYWAGPQGRFTYELTQVNGNIFIRYLPAGVGLGDPRPDFLTVGTYPKARSYQVLKRQGKRSGGHSRSVPGGGIAVWSNSRPQSVYVAYPGNNVQVEVYDPSAQRALRLATSGAVNPIR
jgi:hypothetical protein